MMYLCAESSADSRSATRRTGNIVNEPVRLGDAAKERVLTVIEEARNVHDEEGLKALLRGRVNELIPHQMAAGGIAGRDKRRISITINTGIPAAILHGVLSSSQADPRLGKKAWAEEPGVRIFNDLSSMKRPGSSWYEAVERHGIRNLIIHGLPDIGGENSSYFCLAQSPEPTLAEHGYLMELITPHLHTALLRAIRSKQFSRQERRLTAREQEILHVMCQGYTNKEIAALLGISENTVRNHASRVCEKLGVANRTMAVARANALGWW